MPPVPLAPRAIVAPPAVSPPLHSLVASARTVTEGDSRWEMGFQFRPEVYGGAASFDPRKCNADGTTITSADKSDGTATPLEVFTPHVVEVEEVCSSWGITAADFEGRALRQLEAGQAKQIEHEFWTGAKMHASGDPDPNFSLVYATPVQDGHGATAGILNTTPTTGAIVAMKPDKALAALQQALADAGPGSRGMIHATAYLAELWAQAYYLDHDRTTLVTRTRGTIVVAGSGYTGTGPNGHAKATPAAGTVWAYATRLVDVRLGPVEILPGSYAEALDRRTNTISYRAERTAAAAPDRGAIYAVLVDLT